MKNFLLTSIFIILSNFLYAQTPQFFQYQAVVRDASGIAMANQTVSFQISIISGSINGTVDYIETHTATTNAFGIVTLSIGSGNTTGNFAGISWGSAVHFVKIEADPLGGTSYLDMGTTQLLSVPYALYAETSGNAGQTYTSGTGIDITGNVITNTTPDQTVTLTQGGATTVTGTYPNFTISSTDNNTTYTAGSGLSLTGTTFSNTSPDQTVTMVNGTGITITGSYPTFTVTNSSPNATHTGDVTGAGALTIANNAVTTSKIADGSVTAVKLNSMSATNGQALKFNGTNWAPATDNNTTYTAGTGINVTGTTITNTSPDQTVSLTQGGATTISGTYPNFTISSTDLNSGTPGGLNKTIQFNNSGSFGGNTNFVWDNSNERLGVGTTSPLGRMVVQGSATALATEPLFEVKNKAGQTVFVVYEDSVNVFVNDDAIQANRGGFAVSGRNSAKALTHNYLHVTPDSTRVFTANPSAGFGVCNISTGTSTSYMNLTPDNYFIGHQAGDAITTGIYNSFIGYQSGLNNNTGSNNLFFGYKSGALNTLGLSNVFIGNVVGYTNSAGGNNVFIGDSAGYYNTTSSYSVFLGKGTGKGNTTGQYNSFLGYQSGYKNGAGTYNVFMGYRAGYSNTVSYNTFIGFQSGLKNTTGTYNSFIGYESGKENVDGSYNVAIGKSAFTANVSGGLNVAIGYDALNSNTTGFTNVACGWGAMNSNTSGQDNVGIGTVAMGYNINGGSNTSIGAFSTSYNTAGNNLVALGYQSLRGNTIGNNNTALGVGSLWANTTGSNNTAIGYNSYSTGIYSNSTALGANSIISQNNKVRIGDATVTVIEGQVAYTFPSDARFKNNITEDVKGLDFITKLRPVEYNFDTRKFDEFIMQDMSDSLRKAIMSKKNYSESSNIRQTGFIAQEVEQAAKESGYDFNGLHKPENDKDNYSVAYSLFTVPLVKAVQEQQIIIQKQQNDIDFLKKQLDELNNKIKEFQK